MTHPQENNFFFRLKSIPRPKPFIKPRLSLKRSNFYNSALRSKAGMQLPKGLANPLYHLTFFSKCGSRVKCVFLLFFISKQCILIFCASAGAWTAESARPAAGDALESLKNLTGLRDVVCRSAVRRFAVRRFAVRRFFMKKGGEK